MWLNDKAAAQKRLALIMTGLRRSDPAGLTIRHLERYLGNVISIHSPSMPSKFPSREE